MYNNDVINNLFVDGNNNTIDSDMTNSLQNMNTNSTSNITRKLERVIP